MMAAQLQWPACASTSTSNDWHDDQIHSSQVEAEPRLSVEIPNPWPIIDEAAKDRRTTPVRRTPSTISTKAIAAAVCPRSSRRRRLRSDGSESSTPRAAFQITATDQTSYTSPPRTTPDVARRLLNKRRHERSCSAPECPSNISLSVNTILPLHVHSSTSSSNHMASSSSSFSSSSTDLLSSSALRRNESLTSFVSHSSDGSCHGDDGDEDPDAQLARAIDNMQVQEKIRKEEVVKEQSVHGHGPLRISTYDYNDEEVRHSKLDSLALPESLGGAYLPPTPMVLEQLEAYQMDMLRQRSEGLTKFGFDKDMEEQELAINKHAGRLINSIVSTLFDIGPSLAEDDFVCNEDKLTCHAPNRTSSLPSLIESCSPRSPSPSSASTLSEVQDGDPYAVHNLRPPSPCASPLISPKHKQPTWWRSFAVAAEDASFVGDGN